MLKIIEGNLKLEPLGIKIPKDEMKLIGISRSALQDSLDKKMKKKIR